MEKDICIYVFFVCLMAGSCSINQAESKKDGHCPLNEYRSKRLSLMYPSSVRLATSTPAHDFDILKFAYQDEVFLSAYVGNHPQFRKIAREGTRDEKGCINNLSFESFYIIDENGKERKNIFIRFSDQADVYWPMYIHYWYYNLPPNLENMAKDIINSTKEK